MLGVLWLLLIPAFAVGADQDETTSKSETQKMEANNKTQEETEDDTLKLDEVVITASRVEESLRMVTKSVTVITDVEIQQKGTQSVIDVLNDVPGVTISSYGPPGGAEYMYVRGAANGKTLVMIDGVRVQNPGSTSNALSLAYLGTDNIERIEVVRGAESVLYGSDAMGGVINIITKKGKGKPTVTAGFEGGSFETFKENLGVRGGNAILDYSLQATRTDISGLSKADSPEQEEDEYGNTSLSGKLNARITDKTEVGLTAYYSDTSMETDDSPDPITGLGRDGYDIMYNEMLIISAHLDQDISKWWTSSLKVGNTNNEAEYYDASTEIEKFKYSYEGTTQTASWQNNFFLGDRDTLTAGIDYIQEEARMNSGSSIPINNESAYTTSGFVSNHWTPTDNINISTGLRYDEHENFGSATTYQVSAAYFFDNTGTKIRTSYGTGFKAPSLLQLYYPYGYGNEDLEPEKSKSFDIGIDQYLLDDRLALSIAYFHNDITNLIGTARINGQTQFYNVEGVTTDGLETSLSWRVIPELTLNLHYTYQESIDDSLDRQRTHIPKHTGGGSINYTPWEKFNWNVSAQYKGKRYAAKLGDSYPVVPAQLIFNTKISYDFMDWLQLTARIENFTNEKYQSMYGYTGPGIGFYAGLNLTY